MSCKRRKLFSPCSKCQGPGVINCSEGCSICLECCKLVSEDVNHTKAQRDHSLCPCGGRLDLQALQRSFTCRICEDEQKTPLTVLGTVWSCWICTFKNHKDPECKEEHLNISCAEHARRKAVLARRKAVWAELTMTRCPGCQVPYLSQRQWNKGQFYYGNDMQCSQCQVRFCHCCSTTYEDEQQHFCGLEYANECHLPDCRHMPSSCRLRFTEAEFQEYTRNQDNRPAELTGLAYLRSQGHNTGVPTEVFDLVRQFLY